MEIDSETIPPSPLVVQRETNIIPGEPTTPVDPIALVDSVSPSNIPRDITVGHKRHAWARQTLEEEEGHKSPQGEQRKKETKEILKLPFNHDPHY
jgi:hypothetical protein